MARSQPLSRIPINLGWFPSTRLVPPPRRHFRRGRLVKALYRTGSNEEKSKRGKKKKSTKNPLLSWIAHSRLCRRNFDCCVIKVNDCFNSFSSSLSLSFSLLLLLFSLSLLSLFREEFFFAVRRVVSFWISSV